MSAGLGHGWRPSCCASLCCKSCRRANEADHAQARPCSNIVRGCWSRVIVFDRLLLPAAITRRGGGFPVAECMGDPAQGRIGRCFSRFYALAPRARAWTVQAARRSRWRCLQRRIWHLSCGSKWAGRIVCRLAPCLRSCALPAEPAPRALSASQRLACDCAIWLAVPVNILSAQRPRSRLQPMRSIALATDGSGGVDEPLPALPCRDRGGAVRGQRLADFQPLWRSTTSRQLPDTADLATLFRRPADDRDREWSRLCAVSARSSNRF